MTFDQAQSPRLGQKTAVESTSVRMFSGDEIPEAAWRGQIIYRTDMQTLQVFNGIAWEDVVSGVIGMLTYVGPEQPVARTEGDLWFDSDDGYKLYRWDGSEWIALTEDEADALAGGVQGTIYPSRFVTIADTVTAPEAAPAIYQDHELHASYSSTSSFYLPVRNAGSSLYSQVTSGRVAFMGDDLYVGYATTGGRAGIVKYDATGESVGAWDPFGTTYTLWAYATRPSAVEHWVYRRRKSDDLQQMIRYNSSFTTAIGTVNYTVPAGFTVIGITVVEGEAAEWNGLWLARRNSTSWVFERRSATSGALINTYTCSSDPYTTATHGLSWGNVGNDGGFRLILGHTIPPGVGHVTVGNRVIQMSLDTGTFVATLETDETFESESTLGGNPSTFSDGTTIYQMAGSTTYTSFPANFNIYKFSENTWSSGDSSVWWAAYTWRDSDITGGVHETDLGERTSFTMKRRYRLRLRAGTIQDTGDVNYPNAISYYLGRGATEPAIPAGFFRQGGVLADGVTELYIPDAVFSGDNPPSANDFTTSVPGKIVSAGLRLDGSPKTSIDGSGPANIDGLIPPGSMILWAGDSDPSGWMICDGRAISRTTYADLAEVVFDGVNYRYGNGDGSTTFNIPNASESFGDYIIKL